MLSANDSELLKWLEKNEAVFPQNDKLCAIESFKDLRKLDDKIMIDEYLNYSLFHFSPEDNIEEDAPSKFFYLRGLNQFASSDVSFPGIHKTIHDIWLIASNTRIEFSDPLALFEPREPFLSEEKLENSSCNTGILII